MKTGKVSDTILSRSVLKPVNTVRGKYVKRLDIGQDAGEVQLACQADISWIHCLWQQPVVICL